MSGDTRLDIGWAIIICCTMLIFFELFFVAFEFALTIKKVFAKVKIEGQKFQERRRSRAASKRGKDQILSQGISGD